MKKLIEGMFGKYGRPVTVIHGGAEFQCRGFFQPSGSRENRRFQWEQTPLGTDPEGQYLFIGPVEPQIDAGDILTVGEKGYQVRRGEVYYDREEPLYRWCLCVRMGKVDTWGE